MSSKTVSFLGGAVLGLAFAVGALQSCGGSSSSNTTAVCTQVCEKAAACATDAGVAPPESSAYCMQRCMTETCSNQAELVSAANTCLAKSTCADFIACAETSPQCISTGGTSGTGNGGTGAGTGGTTGTGNGGTGAGTGGTTGTGNGGAGAGTGGTKGTGGGGGSGSATCSVCDKAATCCVGLVSFTGHADASDCTAFSAATCNSLPAASQSAYASECSLEISSGADLKVAACL
jgi:hypothetical protein